MKVVHLSPATYGVTALSLPRRGGFARTTGPSSEGMKRKGSSSARSLPRFSSVRYLVQGLHVSVMKRKSMMMMMIQDLGFRVGGESPRVGGLGFRVQSLGLRVEGLGLGVEGLGFRV